MSDPQIQAIRERQRSWMRERDIDMAKSQFPTGNLSPAELVNTLTDKIATKMQSAMKPQERLERSVADEKDVNTCSVCFELMLPKDRSPILLFPCGHTFCKTCLVSNEKKTGKKVCPWCRTRIESQAINISLQNVIVSYAKNKGLYSEQETTVPVVQPSPQAVDIPYAQQLELINLRCSILQEEIQDTERKEAEVADQLEGQQQLTQILLKEEEETLIKMRKVEQELSVVRDHIARNEANIGSLNKEEEELSVTLSLIKATLTPLLKERDKLQTLMRLQRS